MTLGIDFSSQDFFRDPLPAFERLRSAGPIVEGRVPMIGRVWMTTTQEMASRVLKDNQVFSLRKDDGAVAGMHCSEEMVVMVFLLLFAGHETTTHQSAGGPGMKMTANGA